MRTENEANRLLEVFSSAESLPLLPVAAARLVEALGNPDVPTSEVESIVATDIGLTTGILRFANSAAMASSTTVTSIRGAVLRLGLDSVKALALSLSVGPCLKHLPHCELFDRRRFSRHSLFAGMAGRCIFGWQSRGQTKPSNWTEEQVLAAGVVHDLAVYVLADRFPAELARTYAYAQRKGTTISQAFVRLFGISIAELSAKALETWKFPPFFYESVRFVESPDLAPAGEQVAAASLWLANALANAHGYAIEDWELESAGEQVSEQLLCFGGEEREFVLAAVRRHVEGLLDFWSDDIESMGAIA